MLDILRKIYHYSFPLIGNIIYGQPSRKIMVVGVTGTKGKSTTVEIVNAIFEGAGWKTAVQSTIRFKIGEKEKRNLYKMTTPGRFFMQKFLRDAVNAKCDIAILELTSEGARQFRNKFIYLDALIFTNLAPEHIESHGSYENYVKAKLSIAKEMEGRKGKFLKKVWLSSAKATRGLLEETFLSEPTLIVNKDDKEAEKFLALNIKNKIPYSLRDTVGAKADENGSSFQVGKMTVHTRLPGTFNISNMLGAIALAKFLGIPEETIKEALEKIDFVRGRMEKINEGQDFDVVVDYAHTPDSLRAVYETYQTRKTICILGNTGGGRDKWKRIEMGKIADEYCSEIILTNEDPYDEDPREILEDIKKGIGSKPYEIIMDRREAIRSAVLRAKSGDAILITGKGTDPYIMGPNGSKIEWDDATVAREELRKINA